MLSKFVAQHYKQQKSENKTDTITQNKKAIESDQQCTNDSSIPLVTKTLKFKKSELKQCKGKPYKVKVTLDLSIEYPISGPEKMVRTLNKELLQDVCDIRVDMGTVNYAHSWEELPQVLFNEMESDVDGYGDLIDIEGLSMACFAESKLLCATQKYATFRMDFFACQPRVARSAITAGSRVYCADAKSGKLISFEDIFRKGCEDKLRTILYQELRKQYKYRERNYSDITESNLDLPYDVTLSPDGIIVSYSLYAFEPTPPPDDIEGISFKLPIAKVRPLLTPYAIELLEK